MRGFADQAVIAIENARLLTELRNRTDELTEALEQQTATSNVLGLIASSPERPEPVFDVILDSALQLCEADTGHIWRHDQDELHIVALRGASPEFAEFVRGRTVKAQRTGPTGRAIAEKHPVQVADLSQDPLYIARNPMTVAAVERAGVRTVLYVPMLRGDEVIGMMTIYRRDVRPFAQKHIDLVVNFAAQAVIAIENARLLTELRESLDRQTATSDVLGVIASSPGRIEPVFDTIVENALRFCEATNGVFFRIDDGAMMAVAHRGLSPEWAAHIDTTPLPVAGPAIEMVRTRATIHIADLRDSEAYRAGHPSITAVVDRGGIRTALLVPIVKEGAVVGAINVHRQEVRPFTDKQIELVENFAAQAVIAIENARLLNELRSRTDELREALEQQIAMSEVLGVISASPGELQPVFQSMLANALHLCEAQSGVLLRYDGDCFETAAVQGIAPEFAAVWLKDRFRMPPETNMGRMLATRQVIHDLDLAASPGYLARSPMPVAGVEVGGVRTSIHVPLLKDGAVVGAFIVLRTEVRAFSEKQIDLLRNFAAQAVIAIENARLLSELRESLDRQTATAEVLGVISSSPGNLEPVFDAILDNALRLCEADTGNLYRLEGEDLHVAAVRDAGRPEYAALIRQRTKFHFAPDSAPGRALAQKQSWRRDDARDAPDYKAGVQSAVENVEVGGVRSLLFVPLVKNDQAIGLIGIYRREVRPFTDRHVQLVENFAKQAVIAIENARLLTELRESLEFQTATSEVLRVIAESTTDILPAIDVIAENAARLCDARDVVLIKSPMGCCAGLHRSESSRQLRTRKSCSIDRASTSGRAVLERRLVHINDIAAQSDEFHRLKGTPAAKFGSVMAAPMLREGRAIGAIVMPREAVQPYTQRQRDLLTSFADQAAIAIENARLLTELRESLDRQTATAEVLGMISSSPGELNPVFETMLANAMRLCEAQCGYIYRMEQDQIVPVAERGVPPAYAEFRRNRPHSGGPGTMIEAMLATKKPIHVHDARLSESYRNRNPNAVAGVELGGARTNLYVPMLKRRRTHRRNQSLPPKSPPFHRRSDRCPGELRQAGRDRDRERTALKRIAREPGPPNRDGRHPARHRVDAWRSDARVGYDRGDSSASVRCAKCSYPSA